MRIDQTRISFSNVGQSPNTSKMSPDFMYGALTASFSTSSGHFKPSVSKDSIAMTVVTFQHRVFGSLFKILTLFERVVAIS